MKTAVPRAEHPRPDLRREEIAILNGKWDFAFGSEGEVPCFEKKITVPFVYQSPLSGIGDERNCDRVWYRRTFTVPKRLSGRRVLLRFGAADYYTEVFVDGKKTGAHEGGYSPFDFDVTAYDDGKEHILTVMCVDTLSKDQPRGKQSYKGESFSCWYVNSTGLWQSVWLEAVGERYIKNVRITPEFDTASVRFELFADAACSLSALIEISYKNKPIASSEAAFNGVKAETFISLGKGFHRWSPSNPALYDVKITLLREGIRIDRLRSYFGMRKIEIKGDRILLNGRPLYQRLVLDQGYFKGGILTAPSDETLANDVRLIKKLGYNGARKHQKCEDPRWLYHADRQGLLVWCELPSCYEFTPESKENLLRDMAAEIERDYNHPSVIAWVPLNESWGVPDIAKDKEMQEFADKLYDEIKKRDVTRFVSSNDGWQQCKTDVYTCHDYAAYGRDFSPTRYADAVSFLTTPSHGRKVVCDGYGKEIKPCLFTEYGGIAFTLTACDGAWGYNGAVSDEETFLKRFESLTDAIKAMPFIQGYCYTQLTDVYQEVNGLLDMARNPKIPIEKIRKINLK